MVQIQSNLEHFVGQYLQFSPSSQYQPCLNDVRRFLRKTPRQAEIVPKNQASLLINETNMAAKSEESVVWDYVAAWKAPQCVFEIQTFWI